MPNDAVHSSMYEHWVGDRVGDVGIMVQWRWNALRIICGYATQCGGVWKSSNIFALNGEMYSMVILHMSWLNARVNIRKHVGRHIDGLSGVHGRCGVDRRNYLGRTFRSFAWRRNYVVYVNVKGEGDIRIQEMGHKFIFGWFQITSGYFYEMWEHPKVENTTLFDFF